MVRCQYCCEMEATKELIYSKDGSKAWFCDECAKDVEPFHNECIKQGRTE